MAEPSTTAPRNTVVWALTLIVVVVTASATALILAGKPVGDLLTVFALAGLPVLAYLGAHVYAAMGEVKQQVNGRLSQSLDALIGMAKQQQQQPVNVLPVAVPIPVVTTDQEAA